MVEMKAQVEVVEKVRATTPWGLLHKTYSNKTRHMLPSCMHTLSNGVVTLEVQHRKQHD